MNKLLIASSSSFSHRLLIQLDCLRLRTLPAAGHDQIVAATALTEGTLEVRLANGFVPAPGNLFTAEATVRGVFKYVRDGAR